MATKLDSNIAPDENILYTKSHKLLITWTHQVTWQIKRYISIFTRPVANKLDMKVGYDNESQT